MKAVLLALSILVSSSVGMAAVQPVQGEDKTLTDTLSLVEHTTTTLKASNGVIYRILTIDYKSGGDLNPYSLVVFTSTMGAIGGGAGYDKAFIVKLNWSLVNSIRVSGRTIVVTGMPSPGARTKTVSLRYLKSSQTLAVR